MTHFAKGTAIPPILLARAGRDHPTLNQTMGEFLAAAFSDKTKLILLNTPMNPCAKIFRHDELAVIAGLLKKDGINAVLLIPV